MAEGQHLASVLIELDRAARRPRPATALRRRFDDSPNAAPLPGLSVPWGSEEPGADRFDPALCRQARARARAPDDASFCLRRRLMDTTTLQPDGREAARRDELADRLYKGTIAAFELLHVFLGERLGLYRWLNDLGQATAADLAGSAAISERYAREWLEEQTVAGILDVVGGEGDDRQYRLPAGHVQVLVDRDELTYMTPLALGVVGLAQALPAVIEAFRTGGGVPYEGYGADVRESISWLNRPMFLQQLGRDWFPAVPELDARLRADPPARVADVGCGTGWSSIALALSYPNVTVEGIDLDEASIGEARRNAEQTGVAGRVTFEARDAADPQLAGRYDAENECTESRTSVELEPQPPIRGAASSTRQIVSDWASWGP
jgi:methyltransferase family protein/winged helix-turn-helix protein